ncbi:MAG TPA: hypothetical protein VEB21_21365 [Terriglobales bacterium]|nr:hypothetical protein [Terriglobales bacterium]
MTARARPQDAAIATTQRWLLAAVTLLDLLSFYLFIGDAYETARTRGGAVGLLAAVLAEPLFRAGLALAGAVAAIAFALRGSIWPAIVAIVALALLSAEQAQLFGSPWRHLFFSGVCLTGWIAGAWVGRGSSAYARTGAVALLAAAYCSSGISKVAIGGSEWFSGLPIQAVILGQVGLIDDTILAAYRSWVVTTPGAASFFAVATLLFEVGAPLMVMARKLRRPIALGLMAMHLNILLLTDILYWESMVLLAVFGLAPVEPDESEEVGGLLLHRRFHLAVAILTVLAGLAVWNQARRVPERAAASGNSLRPALPALTGACPYHDNRAMRSGRVDLATLLGAGSGKS